MKITIRYMLHGENAERILLVPPEEYFDALAEGESFIEDGIDAKFFVHEHIDVPTEKLKYLISTCAEGSQTQVTRVQYLDGENVLMQHVTDFDGTEEIIISRDEREDSHHIMRMRKPAGSNWALYFATIGSDIMTEGKYPSRNLIKNWSHEELTEFSYI